MHLKHIISCSSRNGTFRKCTPLAFFILLPSILAIHHSLGREVSNLIGENTNVITIGRKALSILVHQSLGAKDIEVINGNSRLSLNAENGVLAVLGITVGGAG
jgi:hypothetical protein